MKNLTFVIGAGASKEIGLPLGSELKQDIEKMLSREPFSNVMNPPDEDLNNGINTILARGNSSKQNTLFDECALVGASLVLSDSIDAYISSHKDNEDAIKILKSCILKQIWHKEDKSPLNDNKGLFFGRLEGTWYLPFFRMLTKNCNLAQFKERLKTLNFIIFNYDRCVEKFLHHAICAFYRVEPSEALAMLQTIKFHHPYGVAGDFFKDSSIMPFGGGKNIRKNMFEYSSRIKTFSENPDAQELHITEMIASLKKTNILCFLGFSFGDMNMNLLDILNNLKARDAHFYATTEGMSATNIKNVELRLGRKIVARRMSSYEILPLRCNKFLEECSNSIYSDWTT